MRPARRGLSSRHHLGPFHWLWSAAASGLCLGALCALWSSVNPFWSVLMCSAFFPFSGSAFYDGFFQLLQRTDVEQQIKSGARSGFFEACLTAEGSPAVWNKTCCRPPSDSVSSVCKSLKYAGVTFHPSARHQVPVSASFKACTNFLVTLKCVYVSACLCVCENVQRPLLDVTLVYSFVWSPGGVC